MTQAKQALVGEDEPTVSADVDTILAATAKILAVNQGQAEPDDRDSLVHRRVLRPDHLFAERVALDAGKLRRTLLRRLARQRNLEHLPPNYFGPYAEGMIVGHPLSSALEEINPLHLVEQMRRVTAMGPGGLATEDQITPEAQNLNPSSFGFFSSLEGPECHSADTEVYTRQGWLAWPEVTMMTELACRVDGRLGFHCPERLIVEPYVGILLGHTDLGFLVTPNHQMWTRHLDTVYAWYSADYQFGKNWIYQIAESPIQPTIDAIVKDQGWFQESYSGLIYCATVPGSLLFTRRGRGVGFWSGNSSRIGVDTRLAWGARVGDDGRVYQTFHDRRTGQDRELSAEDLDGLTVGMPD